MGIIMAVVAALLIHMERKAVTHMKPSIMEVIASPDNIKARRASLLCRPNGTKVEILKLLKMLLKSCQIFLYIGYLTPQQQEQSLGFPCKTFVCPSPIHD